MHSENRYGRHAVETAANPCCTQEPVTSEVSLKERQILERAVAHLLLLFAVDLVHVHENITDHSHDELVMLPLSDNGLTTPQ